MRWMKAVMFLDIIDIHETIRLLQVRFCATLLPTVLHDYVMQKSVLDTVKAVHPYAISPYSRGGWYTKINDPLPDNPKHRKNLTAPSQADLIVKLVELYGLGNIDNLTMDELYHRWKNHRIKIQTPRNTVCRDEERYLRYFAGTPFFDLPVKDIRRSTLKEFCCSVIVGNTRHDAKLSRQTVEERKMTRKEWGSTRCILNGMFDFALDNEWMKANHLIGMKFEKHLFRDPSHKTEDFEVFNEVEMRSVVKWCFSHFEDTRDLSFLFVPFNFLFGARVGEGVALTWSDRIDHNHISVNKAEYRDRETYQLSVQPHTKTFHNRTVYINDEAAAILDLIYENRDSDEWIFSRNGERLTSRQINYVLEKYAKDNGLDVKSSHKIRKTYGSNLYKSGLTGKQCADILGNTVEVFERYYCFNTDVDDTIKASINSVSIGSTIRKIV